MILPTDAAERKGIPVYSGFIAYFPRAICEVAKVSLRGNQQHHPDTPLHWDKSKSTDEADAMCRHLLDGVADEGVHELAQVAWRAMARLERKLDATLVHAPELSKTLGQHPMMAEALRDIDSLCAGDRPACGGYAAEVEYARELAAEQARQWGHPGDKL